MNKNLELIAELMETGEEFDVIDTANNPYKFIDGILMNGCNCESSLWFNYLTVENIIRKPWEPKNKERYYYATPLDPDGWDHKFFYGSDVDDQVRRNLKFCRTKEKAIEDARSRGWID